jgi:hypothetical protein
LQLSFAHLYRLCTDHPCFSCSEFLPGRSFHHLFFNYANRIRVIFFRKNLVYFMFCSFGVLLSSLPNFPSSRHSSEHRLLSHTTSHSSPCISDATLFWCDLSHTPFFPCILFSHFLFFSFSERCKIHWAQLRGAKCLLTPPQVLVTTILPRTS